MCELLAVSSALPARLTFSLQTLASHGNATGRAQDGWGVAFYAGEDVALFREPGAAADSALVRFLEGQGPSTTLAISHIRHASIGSVQLSNTQPFVRELGGRTHVFAHNGDLLRIEQSQALSIGLYRPVGQTDSERAFCALLSRLQPLWQEPDPPSLEARLDLLSAFAADLRTLGPANFLYADGDALFAHGHRRLHDAVAAAEPPGLWALQRSSARPDPSLGPSPGPSPGPAPDPSPDRQGGVSIAHAEPAIVLIASVPLTGETWRPLSEGELLAVRDGEVLATRLAAQV